MVQWAPSESDEEDEESKSYQSVIIDLWTLYYLSGVVDLVILIKRRIFGGDKKHTHFFNFTDFNQHIVSYNL